jgi:hypothetical protein
VEDGSTTECDVPGRRPHSNGEKRLKHGWNCGKQIK